MGYDKPITEEERVDATQREKLIDYALCFLISNWNGNVEEDLDMSLSDAIGQHRGMKERGLNGKA